MSVLDKNWLFGSHHCIQSYLTFIMGRAHTNTHVATYSQVSTKYTRALLLTNITAIKICSGTKLVCMNKGTHCIRLVSFPCCNVRYSMASVSRVGTQYTTQVGVLPNEENWRHTASLLPSCNLISWRRAGRERRKLHVKVEGEEWHVHGQSPHML